MPKSKSKSLVTWMGLDRCEWNGLCGLIKHHFVLLFLTCSHIPKSSLHLQLLSFSKSINGYLQVLPLLHEQKSSLVPQCDLVIAGLHVSRANLLIVSLGSLSRFKPRQIHQIQLLRPLRNPLQHSFRSISSRHFLRVLSLGRRVGVGLTHHTQANKEPWRFAKQASLQIGQHLKRICVWLIFMTIRTKDVRMYLVYAVHAIKC